MSTLTGASSNVSGGGGGGEGAKADAEQVQLKQGWSLLAAMHCVLLPELIKQPVVYQPPMIDQLVIRLLIIYYILYCITIIILIIVCK